MLTVETDLAFSALIERRYSMDSRALRRSLLIASAWFEEGWIVNPQPSTQLNSVPPRRLPDSP